MKWKTFAGAFSSFVSGMCIMTVIDAVIENNAGSAVYRLTLAFVNAIFAYIGLKER